MCNETARPSGDGQDHGVPSGLLRVMFEPDAIREHFEGTAALEARASRVSDRELAAAAGHLLLTDDHFWAVFDRMCVEVLELAEAASGGSCHGQP